MNSNNQREGSALQAISGEALVERMNQNQEEEMEIDLLELALMLLDQLHYIVFFFLLGALLLNSYAYFFIHPTYQSTSALYIVSASGGSVVDLTDLNIGTSLKSDYQELIMSYPVLDRVSEELNLGLDTQGMEKLIQITNPADTRILKLTATAETPELARDIANTLAEVAVEFLPDTMSTDAPNIAQRARLATKKAGPSYLKYTALGGMLGALACCAWFVVLYLMDDTIRSGEDMEKYFGAVPLATIPYTDELDTAKRRRNRKEKEAGNHE